MTESSQDCTLGVGIGVDIKRVKNEAAQFRGVVGDKLCKNE